MGLNLRKSRTRQNCALRKYRTRKKFGLRSRPTCSLESNEVLGVENVDNSEMLDFILIDNLDSWYNAVWKEGREFLPDLEEGGKT